MSASGSSGQALLHGIVTSFSSRSLLVHVAGCGELRCTLRGTLWDGDSDESRPVTVGDAVLLTREHEDGVIESVEPRRNSLVRPQAGKGGRSDNKGKAARMQVLAANIDRLIVVSAVDDPPFRPGLVDRFLVAAAMQGLSPVLCLNKLDLGPAAAADAEREAGQSRDAAFASRTPDADTGWRALVAPYIAAGIPVLATSCRTGAGIDALRTLMSQGISLLIGHSGVGKSSLLNAVSPGLQLATGEVNDYSGRGRQTTTRSTLLALAGGGFVVDSPGIREFGLTDITPAELARLYPGFGELPDTCRFSDCRHRSEPSCAVRAAVAAGTLSAERHANYLRLLDDIS